MGMIFHNSRGRHLHLMKFDFLKLLFFAFNSSEINKMVTESTARTQLDMLKKDMSTKEDYVRRM